MARRKSTKKETETPAAYQGSAMLRHVRIAPRKARLVVDLVKGKQVDHALRVLQFSKTKGASLVHKLLKSAIANARENHGADVDKLWVSGGWVNEGRTMKRYMPRARGSATEIRKRSSHITLCLAEV
ncbi:MAG: 50S ribosomal protein L22 [Bdellovibrionota bacterium]|nr:MAG: 50S ribosomal protein L22 [Bdellovibrionota bacterium]